MKKKLVLISPLSHRLRELLD